MKVSAWPSGQVQKPGYHLSLVLLNFLFLKQKLLILILLKGSCMLLTCTGGFSSKQNSVCVYTGSKASWTPHFRSFSLNLRCHVNIFAAWFLSQTCRTCSRQAGTPLDPMRSDCCLCNCGETLQTLSLKFHCHS